jgi:hypothetical protein
VKDSLQAFLRKDKQARATTAMTPKTPTPKAKGPVSNMAKLEIIVAASSGILAIQPLFFRRSIFPVRVSLNITLCRADFVAFGERVF